MPTNVQTLQLLNVELTDEFLLVISPQGELTRTPVSSFRGAGFYVDSVVPTGTHPTAGADYKEGDFFVFEDGLSRVVYQWDATLPGVNKWVELGSLLGSVRHTQDTLGTTVYETATTTIDAPNIFGAGDTYFNESLQKTFGPHVVGTGINFNVEAREYYTNRDAHVFVHFASLIDADATKDTHAWTPGDITDRLDPAYAPQRGDKYHHEVTNADHGGYLYTWNEDDYQAAIGAGSNYADSLSIGWIGNDPGNPRRDFWRIPIVHIGTVPPVFDNELYITGDSYFDTVAGLIYSGYSLTPDPAYPANPTADEIRFSHWGTPENVGGTTIHETTAEPVLNDGLYGPGDFLVSTVNNTPVFYGPYITGQADFQTAWSAASGRTMRGSLTHTIYESVFANYPGNIPATHVGQAFAQNNIDGTLNTTNKVREGDRLRVVFVDNSDGPWVATGKEYLSAPLSGSVLNYGTDVLTPNWGGFTNPHGAQSHTGTRTAEDERYSTGDILYVGSEVFGPYVEGAASDELAWPFLGKLDGPAYHQTTLPPTDANNLVATNFSPVCQNGDFLDYSFQLGGGGDSGKVYRYGPAVVAGDGTITWPANGVNTLPTRTHALPDRTRDDLVYAVGDFGQFDGIKFGPYVEGAASDVLAWPIYEELRANTIFTDVSNVVPYVLPVLGTDAVYGGTLPITHDILHVQRTGYVEIYEVTAVAGNNITLGARGFLEGVMTHAINQDTWPPRDDTNYKDGDVAVITTGAKFGPYVRGQGNDALGWPIMEMPAPKVHAVALAHNNATPPTNQLDPLYLDGYCGHRDLIVGTLPSGKMKEFRAIMATPLVYSPGTPLTFTDPVNPVQPVTTYDAGAGRPGRDDNVYSNGDWRIDTAGVMYGPYVEGQVTDAAAWPSSALTAAEQYVDAVGAEALTDIKSYSPVNVVEVMERSLADVTNFGLSYNATHVMVNRDWNFNNFDLTNCASITINDAGAGEGLYFSGSRGAGWGIEESATEGGDGTIPVSNSGGLLHLVWGGSSKVEINTSGTIKCQGHIEADNNVIAETGNLVTGAGNFISNATNAILHNSGANYVFLSGGGDWRPETNGSQNLGGSSNHYKNIYYTGVLSGGSDERAKTFGDDVSFEGLKKLTGKEFTWNGMGGTIEGETSMGFSAQEIHKLYPSIVNSPDKYIQDPSDDFIPEEERFWSMDYSKLVVPLVNYCNSLQKELDDLKSEVAEIKRLLK